MATALAESCINNPDTIFGAKINLGDKIRTDALLFGEAQSRIIVSLTRDSLKKLKKIANKYKVPLEVIGEVTSDRLTINDWIDVSPEQLKNLYYNSIGDLMGD